MKKTLLVAAIFGSFAVISCKKSDNEGTTVTTTSSLADVKVPAGFNWESSRNLNVSVSSTDTRFDNVAGQAANPSQTIAIYDGDPYAGGKLLSAGAASTTKPFATKIYVPAAVTTLYFVKTAPDKSYIVKKVTAVGSADVNLTIGSNDPSFVTASAPAANKQINTTPTSPDCSGGTAITTNTSNLDMNSGDTYSVTGSNITVALRNVNGGTLKVCGTNVTVSGNLSGNGALIVTTSGTVTYTGNMNSNTASVTNFGKLTIPNNRADAGNFYNYGVCTINGDCNMNGSSSTFYNSGTLTISGGWQGGTSVTAINDGAMVVGTNFQTNQTPFTNNCNLWVKGNYNQDNGTVKNYSLIKVDGTATLNDNVELGLYNGAEFLTVNQIANGKIIGYGSTSLDKITGTNIIFNNSGAVTGAVQVYSTQNAITSQNASKINSGATQDHSVYIAKTACNTDGNGTQAVADADGDGVADNLDAYPNDATRAYNVTGATGTVAFEDEWPVKGDFDLNDVVMGYSYTLVTSASNTVVDVNGSYTLYARGGDYQNAFGVEFPVSKALVGSLVVTKNGSAITAPTFEAGQSKAVVVLFTNMQTEMATYNTKLGDIFSTYKTYTLSFTISGGPTLSTFGQDEYNPFIYNSGRHEVHVMGKTPTTLADATLFGTSDDNTSVSAGRYYVTKTGLPYAINLPTVFAYPVERKDITTAYLHLADWAVSGGSSYTDWYSNTATGYRAVGNIFTH